jgi:cytochrome-b5 reductase
MLSQRLGAQIGIPTGYTSLFLSYPGRQSPIYSSSRSFRHAARQLDRKSAKDTSSHQSHQLKSSIVPYKTIVVIGLCASAIYFIQSSTSDTKPLLNQQTFKSFEIVGKEDISSTNAIFTLRFPNPNASSLFQDFWKKGIWSVEFKQPQLQVARSYTPLPPTQWTSPEDLQFLIKREHGGEVSNFLHRLSQGDRIEIRGPHEECNIPQHVTRLVFLAGGTGIAPALQAAKVILERGLESKAIPGVEATDGQLIKPKVTILWANRKTEDCMGRINTPQRPFWSIWPSKTETKVEVTARNNFEQMLLDMQEQHKDSFTIQHFVDEEGTYIRPGDLHRVIATAEKHGAANSSKDARNLQEKKLVMISGPDGFVSTFAGPKVWKEGKQVQGPLGGLIGRMGLSNWQVVKL